MGKEGQCVLIRHDRAFYRMHLCHLMKANKKFGRNEGNKTAKNKINEILREENKGQHNKNLHINMADLKDNSTKKKKKKKKKTS